MNTRDRMTEGELLVMSAMLDFKIGRSALILGQRHPEVTWAERGDRG